MEDHDFFNGLRSSQTNAATTAAPAPMLVRPVPTSAVAQDPPINIGGGSAGARARSNSAVMAPHSQPSTAVSAATADAATEPQWTQALPAARWTASNSNQAKTRPRRASMSKRLSANMTKLLSRMSPGLSPAFKGDYSELSLLADDCTDEHPDAADETAAVAIDSDDSKGIAEAQEQVLLAIEELEAEHEVQALKHCEAALTARNNFLLGLALWRIIYRSSPSVVGPPAGRDILGQRVILAAQKATAKEKHAAIDFLQSSPRCQGKAAPYTLIGMLHLMVDCERDAAAAAVAYNIAAERGNAVAQCNLAMQVSVGDGCEKNIARAIALYNKAAAKGNAMARVCLGICHETGAGAPEDFAAAARLYNLAADSGLALAMYNLGRLYMKGKGVPKDENEAMRLWRLSAQQGNHYAAEALGVRTGQTSVKAK